MRPSRTTLQELSGLLVCLLVCAFESVGYSFCKVLVFWVGELMARHCELMARERAEPLWLCRFAVCLSVVGAPSQT